MISWWPIRGRCPRVRRGVRARLSLEWFEPRAVPSFLPPVNYPTGMQPSAVAVGDFDGDGNLDLAVTNLNARSVTILMGQGDGTFQPAGSVRVGISPRFVAAADFDGDGILDLAVLNHVSEVSASNVQILQGQGDGSFIVIGTYPVGVAASTLVVGDFNGDGFPDLAVASYGSDTVSILLNNGDGTFQDAVDYPAGSGPTSVAVGDFNADGVTDLVVTNRLDGTISVLLGNGDGTFQDPQTFPTAGREPFFAVVGDFNGDGICDLAVANRADTVVSVLLGNGDGSFQDPQTYDAGPNPWSLTTADLNGDGLLDLAVADNNGGVSVLLGNGDGSFQEPQTFPAGSRPFAVAAGDFNGDGFPDLAVANNGSGNASVLVNDGDWSDGTPSPSARFGKPAHAAADDIAAALALAGADHLATAGDAGAPLPDRRTVILPPRPAGPATAGEQVPVDHGRGESPATHPRTGIILDPSPAPWEDLAPGTAELRGPDYF